MDKKASITGMTGKDAFNADNKRAAMNNICVGGLGYVGLTLSVKMAFRGFNVHGVEIKKDILDKLKNFQTPFHEPGLINYLKTFSNRTLFFHSEIPRLDFDAFIITVGTPINDSTKAPNFSDIVKITNDIVNRMNKDSIVILRSTVAIGTTKNIILPILKTRMKEPLLAYCPERTVEGKALVELDYLPQIVSGINKKSIDKATSIFRRITPTIIEVSSPEVAELIKLLDNTTRDIRFGLANEIAFICDKLGLDANEVIKSANLSYERTNIAMPGFAAGPCLSKDPYILLNSLKVEDINTTLITLGRDVNSKIIKYYVDKSLEYISKDREQAGIDKIFLTGLAFKGVPETDDLRGSPALDVIKELLNKVPKNIIFGHDYLVPMEEIKKLGLTPVSLEEGFKNADLVMILNNNKRYLSEDLNKLISLMKSRSVLFDSWNLFKDVPINMKNGCVYGGIGTWQKF